MGSKPEPWGFGEHIPSGSQPHRQEKIAHKSAPRVYVLLVDFSLKSHVRCHVVDSAKKLMLRCSCPLEISLVGSTESTMQGRSLTRE